MGMMAKEIILQFFTPHNQQHHDKETKYGAIAKLFGKKDLT
jgi:hypothetical protein